MPSTDPILPPLPIVNNDSTVPTPLPLPPAQISPPAVDHDLEANDDDVTNTNDHSSTMRRRATLPIRLTEQAWFKHIERHAPFIGLVIGIAAFGATCVGIIIAIVVAVAQ